MTMIRPLYQNVQGKIVKALVTPTGKRGGPAGCTHGADVAQRPCVVTTFPPLLGVQPADLSELLKTVRHLESS